MRAIRVHACGGPEALRYDEIPVPAPQAGEALVKIAAAGVNFIDVQHRAGRYKPPALPFTLGSEAAGTVTAVGAGVTEVAVGDRVAYAMVLGAYAEYARRAREAARQSAGRDRSEDGGSRHAARAHGALLDAQHVCDQSPATRRSCTRRPAGRGSSSRRSRGCAAPPCTARWAGEAKADIARAAGAAATIDYRAQDFEAEIKKLTNGRGVDVVYDSVGKDTFDKSLSCLRPRGMLALFGFSSGPVPPFDPAVLGAKGSLFLTRPGLNQYIATREELMTRAAALFQWLAAGKLKVTIDRVWPLADAAEAHEALEARRRRASSCSCRRRAHRSHSRRRALSRPGHARILRGLDKLEFAVPNVCPTRERASP